MRTSKNWIQYFKRNALEMRVNWKLKPDINEQEISLILKSMQAWQLGETSEGRNLILASTKYAEQIGDQDYVEAVRLFIKEEQKHGNNLGRYLDSINQPRIKKDWGDSLFRQVRYFNTSMEMWTLAVIVVESTAQIFYKALKDATGCCLLKQICTDILIDEADHIIFQTERLAVIFYSKTAFGKYLRKALYKVFFNLTACTVWFAHKKLFKAGGNTFAIFMKRMDHKYLKTINTITSQQALQMAYGRA